MAEAVIQYEEPKELKAEMMELSEIVPMLLESVIDEETRIMAANEISRWDAIEKRWVKYWEKSKGLAHELHKTIKAMENEGLLIVEKNRMPLKKAVSDFILKERERAEKERQRIEIENVKKAEEERKKLLEQAVKAEAKGKDDVAQSLFEQAEQVYVQPVIVPETTPKKVILEDGGSQGSKDDWDISITDERVFARSALAGDQRIPWSAVTVSVSLPALKAWIRSEKIKTFPGLSIVPKVTLTTRRGK